MSVISIAYITGRYEVMMFRGEQPSSNPVVVATAEAAEAQAAKWHRRYGIAIDRPYRFQEFMAARQNKTVADLIDVYRDVVSWWAA